MSNLMSVKLVEWAELASNIKSPIASHLSSLLRSLSELTDDELLNTSITYTREKITVWNSLIHSYADALDLPEGSFCVDFGFLVEQSISRSVLAEVIKELADENISIKAVTQAEIMVKAQQHGLLSDWGKLVLI